MRILQDGQWLSDKHMHAVQKLLKSQFPHISGLQPTVLGSTNQWDVLKSEGVQNLHQTNHWVCMSTIGCPPDTAYFYDSMLYNKSRLPIPVTRDIASLLNASGDVINVKVPQSQLQEGSEDCGLFAIATATSLCYGVPPSMIFWEQRKMRSHLKRCLENMKMTPFPGWQQHQQSLTIPSVTDEPLLSKSKSRCIVPAGCHSQDKRKWHSVTNVTGGITRDAKTFQNKFSSEVRTELFFLL